MIGLVPMAGRGSRFIAEGYRLPKPFIPIMGQPMFVTAIRSLPPADRYIFICQKAFVDKYPFEEEVEKHYPGSRVIAVDKMTEGQACTSLLAEDYLDFDEDLWISAIDSQLVYDVDAFNRLHADKSIDVAIFTFLTGAVTKKDPLAFAYCRTVAGNRVIEVAEKRTISDTPKLDPAVVGTFYYRRAGDFVRGAKKMIAKNIRINNEFYVGTSINQLIDEGLDVRIFPVNKFISFGDPFELELYQAWEEYFYQEKRHPYSGWR